MFIRIKFLIIGLISTTILSCSNPNTPEVYHENILEYYTFYNHYLMTFSDKKSSLETLIELNKDFENRKEKDKKQLNKYQTAEIYPEIDILFLATIEKIEASMKHEQKEILEIKKKKFQDLEDMGKFFRYQRDNSNFWNEKREQFADLYLKFTHTHQLSPNKELKNIATESL